jgi:hypothetical protein
MRKLMSLLAVFGIAAAAFFTYRFYLIDQLRKPVLAQLKDPDSAIFRNERIIGTWISKKAILCGEVNAKNSMGGYVGYKPFTSFGDQYADIGDSDWMIRTIEAQCSV